MKGKMMRNVTWYDKMIVSDRATVSISGKNTFVCHYLGLLVKDILTSTPIQFVPSQLNIQVFSGITLPEVYAKCVSVIRTEEIPCVVYSNASCSRMLSGTKGYERALFTNLEDSIKDICEAITLWLIEYNENPGKNISYELEDNDIPVMHIVANGLTVDFESRKHLRNKKTIYGWLARFSERLGTKNRQETYLKTQLVLSMLNNRLAEKIQCHNELSF